MDDEYFYWDSDENDIEYIELDEDYEQDSDSYDFDSYD